VPRSAKNFANSALFLSLRGGSIVRAVDAAQALAELTEVSSEIEAAVIADDQGNVATTPHADGDALAAAGRTLLEHATRVQGGVPSQVDVATAKGNVFVVRDDGRTIVATTAPEPTAGLVFYDLKTCLRALGARKPKRRRTKPKEPVDEA
jgi:predicted regulator of Ras-like GTPase activity (Roadblock/LC7/MglB family)